MKKMTINKKNKVGSTPNTLKISKPKKNKITKKLGMLWNRLHMFGFSMYCAHVEFQLYSPAIFM